MMRIRTGLQGVFLALRRIVRAKAIDSVLNQSAQGIMVREIQVGCARERDDWQLEVVYSLSDSRTLDDGRPLLFDASECPFAIDSLTCALATPQSLKPATSRTWMLRLRPGAGSWHDATVRCTLHAPDGGAPAMGSVSIPDHLPRVRSRSVAGPLPTVRVDAGPAGAGVFGVSRNAGAFGPELLQGVVASCETGSPDRAPWPVQVLSRLARAAGAGERDRIARLVGTILDFHATFFGMPVSARIAVVPAEEVPGSAQGALLGIRSVRAFGLAGQEEPDDVMLGSRLASLWWGTGCRITGRAGRELEATLRAVAGMTWADYADGPYRANVLRDWERNAASARIPDWWNGAQGSFRHGLHARWSLRLYDAVRGDAELGRELKRLTAHCWGRFTPAEEVLSALRRAGVHLP